MGVCLLLLKMDNKRNIMITSSFVLCIMCQIANVKVVEMSHLILSQSSFFIHAVFKVRYDFKCLAC